MENSLVFVIFFFSTVACITSSHAESVPAFLWKSQNSLSQSGAEDSPSVRSFLEGYFSDNSDSNDLQGSGVNIIALVKPQIDTADMLRASDSFNMNYDQENNLFKNLQSMLSREGSSFLPSRENPIKELKVSSANHGLSLVEKTYDSSDDVAHMVETTNMANIIYLPENMGWGEIDALIGELDNLFQKKGMSYAAIFTSFEGFQPIRSSEVQPSGRRLMQDGGFPSYYIFVNVSNCIYFYTQNITIGLHGETWHLTGPFDYSQSECANDTATLSMSWSNSSNVELNLTMVFSQTVGLNYGYWYMSNFSVSYTNDSTPTPTPETKYLIPYFVTETPFGFSYSCYTPPIISPQSGGVLDRSVNVTFVGLQVQAFYISNYQFGYYNDCVGFFNIMTWACLITLFVLGSILMFAACMFAGLSTQDRFDDVHGKTITVANAE